MDWGSGGVMISRLRRGKTALSEAGCHLIPERFFSCVEIFSLFKALYAGKFRQRVVLFYGFAQCTGMQVGINLGGGDG